MNRFLKFRIHRTAIITLLIFIGLTACLSDSEPTDREAFISSIANTWAVTEESTIILDDQDITHLLLGFEIVIDDKLNFTSNSDKIDMEIFPWPTEGNFLLDADLSTLTRNDGMVINIDLTDEEYLILGFQYTDIYENSQGRTKGIRGSWEMKCKRK